MSLSSQWSNKTANVIAGVSEMRSVAAGAQWVVAGSRDGTVKLIRGDKERPEAVWPSSGGPVVSVALSSDESLAATGSRNGRVRVFGVPAGAVLADLDAHRDVVTCLAFSHDGTHLATGSKDRTVRLWQRKGDSFHSYIVLPSSTGPVASVRFSADDKYLAMLVTGECGVRVWHLDRLRRRLAKADLD